MSTTIAIHLCAATLALASGAVLMARAKGTRPHRLLGRCWVALMAIVAISSLWIPSFLAIGWIHAFTLVVAVNVPRAILAIRRGDVAVHRWSMIGSLAGLAGAALFALFPGRLLGSALARLLATG
ncbi:MAG: DUF2306 domain-containing protein [Alphaproteobacteria bacterium]